MKPIDIQILKALKASASNGPPYGLTLGQLAANTKKTPKEITSALDRLKQKHKVWSSQHTKGNPFIWRVPYDIKIEE